ncbi:hypothetical protein Scep_020507 [Stephania cephalantha]|uniref:Uncharacterized protein n=1 Tax=Stephania cephalantha TaxID=152367 RepID=A0AAP0NN88_9MAGN
MHRDLEKIKRDFIEKKSHSSIASLVNYSQSHRALQSTTNNEILQTSNMYISLTSKPMTH